jgi:hypothetical protein
MAFSTVSAWRFSYATALGVELHAKEIVEEALGVNEQAIVDAALRRRLQQAAPERSLGDHVKAPGRPAG